MRNKAISLLLFLCVLGLQGAPVFSQEAAAPAISDARKENIKRLLVLTNSSKIAVQVMRAMLKPMKVSAPQVPAQFWESFMNEVHEEDLMDQIVPIYAKYYTDDEIKGLIAFYESPLGVKVISVLPSVMQESVAVGQTWGREMAKRAIEKLKAKGYLKTAEEPKGN